MFPCIIRTGEAQVRQGRKNTYFQMVDSPEGDMRRR
jgi:hypothetical protein